MKRYKEWVLEESGFIERFFREINIGRTVTHPNVLRIFGGVLDDRRRPALLMELYEGDTLADEIQRRRVSGQAHDFDSATLVLRSVAEGLDALHAQGVIHRDVKPANVLLGNRGPVLADLGVVKAETMPEQTTTGTFLGTIRYAAPEYLFGEEYDRTADIYSFRLFSL